MKKQKKIGILTSGGDAPGMNATIRAVVRSALHHDMKVIGIKRGYEGLMSGEIEELEAESVSNILSHGGTILLTARCQEMMTDEGVDKAANVCKILGLDGLVVIGGDGSMRGGLALTRRSVKVYGIPATIDLDLPCTEYTIGFDTAVNSGMEAINKIRDTSFSHERVSVVEVMGRSAGYIALWCGLTGGAEEIIVPEEGEMKVDDIMTHIFENRARGKNHSLVVVAEGVGGTAQLAKRIEEVTGTEARPTILGYLQRGGAPTAMDRMHASVMGVLAVESMVKKIESCIIVYKNGKHTHIGLEEGLLVRRPYDDRLHKIAKLLAI